MPNRINYHHLYYFWRVASIGHLTQAAQKLHLSQSALSAQIKQLEGQIGQPLFDREGRKLVLSDLGNQVFQYAQEIFSTGEELQRFLASDPLERHQHVRIGVETHLSRNFIEAFVEPLLRNEEVSFSLYARPLTDLLEGINNHDLDVALTNHPITNDVQGTLWQNQLLARQSIAIVGPSQEKLPDAFPHGYEQQKWILPARNMGIRSVFESFCASHQYRATIKAEVDDMAMMRLLARDSGYLAVLPPVVVKDEIESGRLAVYQQLPQAFEHFYAISLPRKFMPEIMLTLLKQTPLSS